MKDFDIGIIGGGIIGCAIARELSRYSEKTAVFEKLADIGAGTTKGNGGFIHAGYDPLPGTLKAKLNSKGCLMYPDLARELNFPYKKTGCMVVGFHDDDLHSIEELYKRGQENGVPDLEIISGDRIFELEPEANREIRYALYSPNSAVTDPYKTTIAFAENAVTNGVRLFRNCEVREIRKLDDGFLLKTSRIDFQVKYVINAAGIYADDISQMAGAEEFHIICKHGDLIIFDKSSEVNMSMSLFPTSTSATKGIALGTKIAGNPSLGSTSIIRGKGDIDTYKEGVDQLLAGASRLVPNIKNCKIVRAFAGARAVVENNNNDFYIRPSRRVPGLFHVAGIQSPGVACAPAIAEYVVEMLLENSVRLTTKDYFKAVRTEEKSFAEMSDEERNEIIARNPAYGKIVCRCEMVTEGEIMDAIHSVVGATTVGGVKRRTRAGMGRCQSGFCQHRVIEILARELQIDPCEVYYENEGSNLLFRRLKGADIQ